jgi:hypothetical protein
MLNKIISADDLHWCEEEKKYVSLSEDELEKIMMNCIEQDITELEDIYKMIQWAGLVRVGNLLLNNFLNNTIKVVKFDENNEPCFGEKIDEFK